MNMNRREFLGLAIGGAMGIEDLILAPKSMKPLDMGASAETEWRTEPEISSMEGWKLDERIAGWLIGNTFLVSGSGANTVGLDSGGVNPAIYAGSNEPSTAPFRVTQAGALVATSATITGTITATAGAIGGWTIAATYLTSAGLTIDSSGFIAVGATDILTGDGVFMNVTPARFRVGTISGGALLRGLYFDGTDLAWTGVNTSLTAAGAFTATSATITGAITATSGTIGSFTIGTYLYTGSKTAYNDANAGVHVGSDGIGIGNNVFTVNGSTGALVATSATMTGSLSAASANVVIDSNGITIDPDGTNWLQWKVDGDTARTAGIYVQRNAADSSQNLWVFQAAKHDTAIYYGYLVQYAIGGFDSFVNTGGGDTLLFRVLASGNTTITGTLTVNGDQTGATDHVFDGYDDMELIHRWRRGEELPFAQGDILNRDRLLRDAIVSIDRRLAALEAKR